MTPADSMTPRSLRRAARTLDRAAEHVLHAGPLWAGALRAGRRHAERTSARFTDDPGAASDAAAWRMACDRATTADADTADAAARAIRRGAACLREIADDVAAGRIECTETLDDAQGIAVLHLRPGAER